MGCLSSRTFSTLNRGFSFDRMAFWHCALTSEALPLAPGLLGTRNSTSCSGPPPGDGTPTAAASCMPDTPSTHARSSSTELTCTPQDVLLTYSVQGDS